MSLKRDRIFYRITPQYLMVSTSLHRMQNAAPECPERRLELDEGTRFYSGRMRTAPLSALDAKAA